MWYKPSFPIFWSLQLLVAPKGDRQAWSDESIVRTDPVAYCPTGLVTVESALECVEKASACKDGKPLSQFGPFPNRKSSSNTVLDMIIGILIRFRTNGFRFYANDTSLYHSVRSIRYWRFSTCRLRVLFVLLSRLTPSAFASLGSFCDCRQKGEC